ncbi:hypothetical protein ACLOJK_030520 [Asimina triloba]
MVGLLDLANSCMAMSLTTPVMQQTWECVTELSKVTRQKHFVMHLNENHSSERNAREEESYYFVDREAVELLSKFKAQQEEILVLREQIATASIKELELLNEKHVLERRLSDLRMAIDEKQNESITTAMKELAHRKSYLEENLKLANDLKAVEDERYTFTSSMLSLLAEFGVRPRAINASAITNSTKGQNGFDFYPYNPYPNGQKLESTSEASRFLSHHDLTYMKDVHNEAGADLHHPFVNDNPKEFTSNTSKMVEGLTGISLEDNAGKAMSQKATPDSQFQMLTMHEELVSSSSEGATNPDYVVTADDVDKLLSVECIPMDDVGHQRFTSLHHST